MTTADRPLTRREFYEEILPNLATKADLASLETRLIKWMIGIQLLTVFGTASVVGAVVGIMRLLEG